MFNQLSLYEMRYFHKSTRISFKTECGHSGNY